VILKASGSRALARTPVAGPRPGSAISLLNSRDLPTCYLADFDKHIYGLKRLGWPELDKIIATMKRTRTDLKSIGAEVMSKGSYPFAEPM